MKKGLFGKGLVFGIIFLFIGSFVIPSIGKNIKKNEKLAYIDISKEMIENLNGLRFDNSGYVINNKVKGYSGLIKPISNGPGKINPLWITIEDIGYIFSMKAYKNYIYAIGYEYIPENESGIALMAKYNVTDGELLWVKTWEGTHPNTQAIDLDICNDYIYIVGYTGPSGFVITWMDSFLCKCDLDGNFIWNKVINETNADVVSGIRENDNFLYLCGCKDSSSWILKYDINGNKIWDKTYKKLGTWFSEFLGIEIYNGYIYTEGQTDSNDKTRQDVFVAKTSLNGDSIWKKEWGEEGPQLGARLVCEDGYIYVCGYGRIDYTPYSPSCDVLLKYNTNGVLQWDTNAKTNSGLLDLKLHNGSIYTTGEIWRNPPYDIYGDAVLQKYDSNGKLIWYLTYGENGNTDYTRSIDIYNDNIFLYGISDFWDFILKYDIDHFSDNNKPETPDKPSGPIKGVPGNVYDYNTSTTDPDDDLISYCFSWGDENVTITTWMNSGELVTSSYIWSEKGIYKIKVRARDECGFVSDWSDPLSVSMPRTIVFSSLFLKLLERIPSIFPILRHLIRQY
jgi:hypothetical protein